MSTSREDKVVTTTNVLHAAPNAQSHLQQRVQQPGGTPGPRQPRAGRAVRISENLPQGHSETSKSDREIRHAGESSPEGRQLVRAYSMSGAAMERNRRRRSILKQDSNQEGSPKSPLKRRVSFADMHQQSLEQVKEVPNTHYGPDADHAQNNSQKKKKKKRRFHCQIL